jgi:predicted ArsR family transcriptional regulator
VSLFARDDRRLGSETTTAPGPAGPVGQLVGLLDELGFEPDRHDAGDHGQVGLHHCPFLELAERRSAVVCPIHLGLMQGALQSWDAPVTVDRLEPFAEPDLCLARLAPHEGSG